MKKRIIICIISTLLAVTALVSGSAFAADTAEIRVTEQAVNEAAGIYKLVFEVMSPKVRSAQFVFSYTKGVILPCAPDGTEAVIPEATQDGDASAFVKHSSFTLLPVEYITDDARVTVNVSLSTEGAPLELTERTMIAEFYYKVTDKNAKTADTFRFEKTAEQGGSLEAVFPDPLAASPVKLDNASTVLYLSEDGVTGAVVSEFTFEFNSDTHPVSGILVTSRSDGDTPYSETKGYDNLARITVYKDITKAVTITTAVLEKPDTATARVPFELALPVGDYYAVIEKNGYVAHEIGFTVTEAGHDLGEIVLAPGDIKGSYGDFSGDGYIDIDDFIRILRAFAKDASEELRAVTDINEDGTNTVEDIEKVKDGLNR